MSQFGQSTTTPPGFALPPINQNFSPIPDIPNYSPRPAGAGDPSLFNTGEMGGNVPGQPGLTMPGGAGEIPGFFDPKGGSRFIIPGMEALTGIGNYFLAKDQLDLGRDQFGFAKDQSNRDFNSQASVFNTNLEDSKASSMRANSAFDTSTPEGQAKFDQALSDYVEQNSVKNVTL